MNMPHSTLLSPVMFSHTYRAHTQKNGAVSEVITNVFVILHGHNMLCRQRKLSEFLMRYQQYASHAWQLDQFPRWRCSRRRLSVCFVLRCPDLWLQCTVSFVHGLKKAHHTRIMDNALNCNKNKTPWSESASELCRPSDRRFSAKWLPTFADKGCHVVSVTNPYGRILGFLDRSRYFSIK
jgi:hypothetical protein